MLAEWTIRDQLRRLQSLEAVLCDKLGPRIHLDSFVASDKEEEDVGLMPYSSSMPRTSSKQAHVLGEYLVQCIKHSQDCIFNLQRSPRRNRLFIAKGERGGPKGI